MNPDRLWKGHAIYEFGGHRENDSSTHRDATSDCTLFVKLLSLNRATSRGPIRDYTTHTRMAQSIAT